MCVNMKVVERDINVWETKIVILKSFSNILRTCPKKGSQKPNEEVKKNLKNNCQNCEQIV